MVYTFLSCKWSEASLWDLIMLGNFATPASMTCAAGRQRGRTPWLLGKLYHGFCFWFRMACLVFWGMVGAGGETHWRATSCVDGASKSWFSGGGRPVGASRGEFQEKWLKGRANRTEVRGQYSWPPANSESPKAFVASTYYPKEYQQCGTISVGVSLGGFALLF